jgi:hypothetical protein
MPATITIKHRRGTASQWTTANTILGAGEVGFETDTGQFKIGDGTTAWTTLAYAAITLAAGDTRYVLASTRGAASGVATLDGSGKIPSGQIPSIRLVSVQTVANQAAMLALAADDDAIFAIRSDTAPTFVLPAGAAPATLQATSAQDAANGYAGLDAGGLLKVAEFPVLDGGTP